MPLLRCWWHSGVFILFIRHRYDVGVDNTGWVILPHKESTIGELSNLLRPGPFSIGCKITANTFEVVTIRLSEQHAHCS